MGLLAKIALLLAFLVAFAIPWLGATANGMAVSDAPFAVAGGKVLVKDKPAGPSQGSAVKRNSAPAPSDDMDEGEEDYDEEPPAEEPQDLGPAEQGSPEGSSSAPEPAQPSSGHGQHH